LRRHEAVALTLDHLQQREGHWAATLAASSGFDQPSMIALASSRILELGAVVEGLPTCELKAVGMIV
jgi:hypothetical protein